MKSVGLDLLVRGAAGTLLLQGAVAAPALAQDSAASRMDEVVVTARRREENLQSTPVAVTAVTEKTLELKQIVDVADIQRTAPNLGITSGATAGSKFVFVSLRGQQNLQAGVGNDPAVGIYVDGIYMARPSTGVFDLDDVARVEVLRGPQGTLFGRNTIGGALNVVTNAPSDLLEGKISVDAGNYDALGVSGMLNVPVGDDLSLRLVGHHKEHSGYGRNVTLDQDASDLDRDDFLRLRLDYGINADWDVTFAADWNEIKDSGVLNSLSAWQDATGLLGAFGISLDPYLQTKSHWYQSFGGEEATVDPDYTPFDAVRTYGFGLTLNGDLEWANFKSISAWRSSSSTSFQDLDATPVGFLSSLSNFATESYSQEFQLSGGAGKLSWTSGVFYFREAGEEGSEAQAFGFVGLPFFQNLADVENISYAAYLQTYYDLSDKVRAVAGFRYTWDERNAVLKNRDLVGDPSSCNVPFPDSGGGCRQTLEEKFTYPAWLLGLDYQLNDDIFLYAKTSGASMAGGWNLRFGTVPAYEPQNVKDVELGIKADWLDQRLRTNIAVFHLWQSDVQRNVAAIVNGRSTQYVRNAGDSKIYGVEIEGTAIPWEGLEINATLGWMKGSYDKGTYTELQPVVAASGPTPAGCTFLEPGAAPGTSSYACFVDRSDEELLQLPEISYSLGATQTWTTGFGEVQLHADYSYIDDQTFFEQTPAAQHSAQVQAAFTRANQVGRQPGYGLWNATATLTFDNPSLTLSLWGRNLADKKYVQMNFAELYTGLGTALNYVGDPRTYGMTLSYRFAN